MKTWRCEKGDNVMISSYLLTAHDPIELNVLILFTYMSFTAYKSLYSYYSVYIEIQAFNIISDSLTKLDEIFYVIRYLINKLIN